MFNRIRAELITLNWFLVNQVGLDIIKIWRLFYNLPLYTIDAFRFRANYKGRFEIKPCMHDRYQEGGATKSEYFWQDLLVARLIFKANPLKHVDVGSRVDGFVAHVASFREIEVFDVRPITTVVPGIVFKQADLMKPFGESKNEAGYCDSLSCLHALEHFGLGRYGDPIDTNGYKHGIVSMSKLLKPQGLFYLSTPIGSERVEFNANRIFDPRVIIKHCEENGLCIKELIVIQPNGEFYSSTLNEERLMHLSQSRYNLGIFVFKKL